MSFACNQPRIRAKKVFNSQQLNGGPVSSNHCQLHVLCKFCQRLVRCSRIIRRSWFPIVCITERHQLHHSLQSFKTSVKEGCHFCTLVWEAIFENRAEIIRSDIIPVTLEKINQKLVRGGVIVEIGGCDSLVVKYGNKSVWIELCLD